MHHDPTQTSLDNPASFNDMKAANSGVSLDDFDVDSEICAVLNDGVLEAGVDPALGDAGVGLLRLVEKAYSYGVFREARGSDGHCEEQADRVGEDASLPAYDLLRGVGSLAGQGHVGGGLHALGVDDGGRRFGFSALFHAGQTGQVVVELGKDSLVAPGGETVAVVLGAAAVLAVPAAATGTGPGDGARPAFNSPADNEAGRAAGGASMTAVLRAFPQLAAGILMAGVGGVCWFGFSLGLAVLGVELEMPGALIAAGMSGYGSASVLASFLVPVVIDRLPRMRTMVVSWAVLGLAFALIPVAAPNLALIAAVAALGGAAMPWGIAALNALISEQTSGAQRRTAFTAEAVLHSRRDLPRPACRWSRHRLGRSRAGSRREGLGTDSCGCRRTAARHAGPSRAGRIPRERTATN